MSEPSRAGLLPRLAAELAVIVVGILLALAVDAAWDRRADRRLEERVLTSLESELHLLDEQLDALARRDSALVRRADAFPVRPSDAPADSISALVAELFATVPRQPFLPTYDELISTGNLRVISDRDLRLLLTRFGHEARTLEGYTDQMDAQWNLVARPVLYRAVAWPVNPGNAEERIWAETPPDLSDDDFEELKNVVRDRRGFAVVHARLVGTLQEVVDEMSAATSEALRR